MKMIRALTRYGPRAAATRVRLLQFAPLLEAAGYGVRLEPLFDDALLDRLDRGRRADPVAVARGYARRLAALRRPADLVWVQYELLPFLPLERLAAGLRAPLIVDYDDAIFHRYDCHIALRDKLTPLWRAAAAVTVGNPYLAARIAPHARETMLLPSVVDTDVWRPGPRAPQNRPRIGWMGSPTTFAHVAPLLPLLGRLVAEGIAEVRLVGAPAGAEVPPGVEAVPWRPESEVAEVQAFDIGIMPLPDSPFERGKCGYKLIQAMACARPVVASPVGVNAKLVTPDVGLLATSGAEWEAALRDLLGDPARRERLGAEGRARVEAAWSLRIHGPRLVDLVHRFA